MPTATQRTAAGRGPAASPECLSGQASNPQHQRPSSSVSTDAEPGGWWPRAGHRVPQQMEALDPQGRGLGSEHPLAQRKTSEVSARQCGPEEPPRARCALTSRETAGVDSRAASPLTAEDLRLPVLS